MKKSIEQNFASIGIQYTLNPNLTHTSEGRRLVRQADKIFNKEEEEEENEEVKLEEEFQPYQGFGAVEDSDEEEEDEDESSDDEMKKYRKTKAIVKRSKV